jgi:hypothetical protein
MSLKGKFEAGSFGRLLCGMILEIPRSRREGWNVEIGFHRSSYLLDATDPKRLWLDKFCKRNQLNLNFLLRQSIERFTA